MKNMKRIALIAVALVAGFMAANAQKFALMDMEYVLKNSPSGASGTFFPSSAPRFGPLPTSFSCIPG